MAFLFQTGAGGIVCPGWPWNLNEKLKNGKMLDGKYNVINVIKTIVFESKVCFTSKPTKNK